MRSKNSDIAVKIFLVVVAVILVGLLIAWSMGVFKDKKNDLDEGTEKINNAISSMAEFDLLIYDGHTISGNLLMELCQEASSDSGRLDGVKIRYLTIARSNEASPTPVVYSSSKLDKSDKDYINPNGIFKGEVKRDDNGVINEIIFSQQ